MAACALPAAGQRRGTKRGQEIPPSHRQASSPWRISYIPSRRDETTRRREEATATPASSPDRRCDDDSDRRRSRTNGWGTAPQAARLDNMGSTTMRSSTRKLVSRLLHLSHHQLNGGVPKLGSWHEAANDDGQQPAPPKRCLDRRRERQMRERSVNQQSDGDPCLQRRGLVVTLSFHVVQFHRDSDENQEPENDNSNGGACRAPIGGGRGRWRGTRA